MTSRVKSRTLGIKPLDRGVRAVPALPEPTIAAGFVLGLLELAVSKGASRKLLTERSGIDPLELEDQDNRIPFVQFVGLMRAGKELCDDPALALHFGEAFDLSKLSIVGLIAAASETMADALAQVNRYTKLGTDVGDMAASNRLVLTRERGQFWLVDTRGNLNDFPELTESSFARTVCDARRALGEKQFIKAVHFTHKAPLYRAEYERIFQLPLIFESDKNALLMDGDAWLTMKTPLPSRYVFGILSERAETLLKSLESSKSTTGRVQGLLVPILHTGNANMDMIAGKLGLSRATLYRKLKGEDTSFEKVQDDLRHKMALNYLSGKQVSVNETAYLVGFSDRVAFSRAFKRWTGSSPGQRRAN